MKRSPSPSRVVLVLCVMAVALAALTAQMMPAAASSPEDDLRDAWQRAREGGAYAFTADAEQTLTPPPLPSLLGQPAQRVDLVL